MSSVPEVSVFRVTASRLRASPCSRIATSPRSTTPRWRPQRSPRSLNGRDMADGQFAFTVKATRRRRRGDCRRCEQARFCRGTDGAGLYVPRSEGRRRRLHRYSRRSSGGLVFTQADAGKTFCLRGAREHGRRCRIHQRPDGLRRLISVADDGGIADGRHDRTGWRRGRRRPTY